MMMVRVQLRCWKNALISVAIGVVLVELRVLKLRFWWLKFVLLYIYRGTVHKVSGRSILKVS